METFGNLFKFLFSGFAFGLVFAIVIHYIFQVVNLRMLPDWLGGRD